MCSRSICCNCIYNLSRHISILGFTIAVYFILFMLMLYKAMKSKCFFNRLYIQISNSIVHMQHVVYAVALHKFRQKIFNANKHYSLNLRISTCVRKHLKYKSVIIQKLKRFFAKKKVLLIFSCEFVNLDVTNTLLGQYTMVLFM